MWLLALIAVGALGFSAYQWAFARGAASRQGEINALVVRYTLLQSANETANLEATRKAQEAAQRAKATEDEANTRIAAARAAADAAEAARVAGAGEFDRRLQRALAARTCPRDSRGRDSLREAAGPGRPAGPEADGVVFDGLAADLREFAATADRINDAYIICRAASRAGREVVTRKQ